MSGCNCSVPKVQGGLLKNTMYMQYEETEKVPVPKSIHAQDR
jgi:hypothetical protein